MYQYIHVRNSIYRLILFPRIYNITIRSLPLGQCTVLTQVSFKVSTLCFIVHGIMVYLLFFNRLDEFKKITLLKKTCLYPMSIMSSSSRCIFKTCIFIKSHILKTCFIKHMFKLITCLMSSPRRHVFVKKCVNEYYIFYIVYLSCICLIVSSMSDECQ